MKRNAQVGAAVESVVKDATQLDKINGEEKMLKKTIHKTHLKLLKI